MKRTIMKILGYVLAMTLIFALFPMTAQAATGAQDGLDVSLTTDKTSYAAGETVTVNVSVTNNNAVAVSNVKLEVTLPSGLVLQTGSTDITIASLAAGATESRSLTALAMSGIAAQPTASPAGGTYATAQIVTLSTTTAGATIYYTTDGSDPTTSGTKQTYGGAINVPMGTTLKAYATKTGMTDSAVMTEVYTQAAPGQHAITVTASPSAGGSPVASPTNAAQGETITLTANPAANYRFDSWTVNSGGVTIANNSFTMPDNAVSVTANYTYDGGGSDPDPGPTYTYRTLTDPVTSISVSGYFTSGATLSVTRNAMHREGACTACDEIRAQRDEDNVLVLYDISVSGGHQGELEVSIPVGTAYNGQSLTVLHCNSRTLERKTITAQNGFVTGTWSGLSPFAVLKPVQVAPTPTPENHNPDTGIPVPQTGDSSSTGLWIAMLVVALCFAGLAVWQLAKKRKGAKFLSLFLCAILLTSLAAPALPAQAATTPKDFTISESITVEGTAKQITLKTSYDWADTYSLSVNNANGQPSADYGTVAITTGTAANNIAGTSVTVTATPQTGYSFWKWAATDDVTAAAVSTDAAYTFNITIDTTLYAVFSKDSTGLPYTFGSGSISAGSAATGALVIPNVIDKQIVTQIGYECFDNNDNITSVAIPSTVTVINGYAFQYCDNLASVTFGADSQLTTINKDAFYELPLLTSFVFPATVTYVGGQSFAYSGLKEVTFLGNRPAFDSIDGQEAFRCCTALNAIYYTAANTTGWPGDAIEANHAGVPRPIIPTVKP